MNLKKMRGYSLIILVLLLAGCNLPVQKKVGSSPTGLPQAASTPAGSAVSPAVLSPGVLSVVVTSPADGAQLAGGAPVDVQFVAAGGPFLEAILLVDETVTTSVNLTSSVDAQLTNSLQWQNPAAGAHVLRVEIMDVNKNLASAVLNVQVGPAAAATLPAPVTNAGGDMQIHFVNLADGGSVAATLGADGKPVVPVQVEVTGSAPFAITFSANGIDIPAQLDNPQSSLPFSGQIAWSPQAGGGEYSLVATAISNEKQIATASVRITVTGVAAYTQLPPALDRASAQARFAQLYKELYDIDVPLPSVYRFDSVARPDIARWISAVYYRGKLHYLDLYDDGHHEFSGGDYAGVTTKSRETYFVVCRPSGNYRILVAFVDYGNLTVNRDEALALVPQVADEMNLLYDNFAHSQGQPSGLMHLQAQGVYLPVPERGKLLSADKIRSASGVDPAQFDIIMQVDLDADNTVGKANWKGVLDLGGGIALQGCGAYYDGSINIWSLYSGDDLRGVLLMDFNHEFSHLLGMFDTWPRKSITLADGTLIDDWITYDMFGWSDADGDGVPEIIDQSPYGTTGPQP
jgi:hypothetical protein